MIPMRPATPSPRVPTLVKAALLSGLALATLAGLGACGNQKPLHIVKSDGEFAYRTQNYEAAIESYEEFTRRKPENADMRHELARSYLAAGMPRRAMEEAIVCLDVKPLNDAYLDTLAQAMFDAGERDALTSRLRQNASERGRVSDYIRLGRWSAKLGNPDEAKDALLTAARLDGGRSLAPQLELADFYGSLGDTRNQVRRIRMAYFIDPSDSRVTQRIRDVGEIAGPTFPLKPEEYILPPL
jgi:tetratricopeptide (TPR) repeat protein